ncbi:phosphoethanolamine--lipid A transferase [Actinobacillus genomosp. 1]|uniref:phosphoethanolamine transferase n=1 Tax=Actinobacillus genomosp. 1 TaxID=254839 RepID=UPI00244288B2|nr:phosphoethanolamine--lipid A transferase [Actinobacillus genomosp. 1]WGE33201.1 phosphoethanolamine--lipid A transferase [Actinobacillus genomosp. 1]
MKFKRPQWHLSQVSLIALVSLYVTVALNIGFFRKVVSLYQFTGTSADYFIYTMPLVLFAALNIVLNLLSLPFIHKVIVPLLILLSAAVSYNSLFFNVYFDRDMLTNVLQTNPAESLRMMTPSYLAWIFFLGIVPALAYLNVRIAYQAWWKEISLRIAVIFTASLMIFAVASQFYQDYASFFRNNKYLPHLIVPSNFVAASVSKIKHSRIENRPFEKLAENVKIEKPDRYRHVTVIVLGETTRAMNWGLNGYARQTTPKMAARLASGENLINFSNVSSCGTATAISVPCLFSSMTREQYDEVTAKNQDNLLDILSRAGVNVVWIENNSDSKGVANRVKEINTFNGNASSLCTNSECLDEVMLPELDKALAENSDKDTVIVLHTIGSHGPTYYERYTENERLFTPTCDTNEISKCSNEELVNTYDNGIVYLDKFLDQVLQRLERRDDWESAVYYFSDHGESLGENDIYLHSTPYSLAPKEQTKVPMMIWFSKSWEKNEPFDLDCIKRNADKPYSHDNVFHTVFSLLDIDMNKHSLPIYDISLNIVGSCHR